MGARAGKYKFGARPGKYKLGAKAGKYKLGARVGKYKFGPGPVNRNSGPGAGKCKYPFVTLFSFHGFFVLLFLHVRSLAN